MESKAKMDAVEKKLEIQDNINIAKDIGMEKQNALKEVRLSYKYYSHLHNITLFTPSTKKILLKSNSAFFYHPGLTSKSDCHRD